MKMLAIVRTELRQRRWSLLWWSVALVCYIGINLAFYPAFKDSAAQLNQALANIPQGAKALLTDTGDFLSPVGYLSSKVYYLILPLLLSIFTINLGAGLLAKEEQQGTLELLLARPVSRTKILVAKLVAGLIALFGLTAVTMLTAVISVHLAGIDVSRRNVALATVAAALLSLLFGAVAFMFSALGRPARAGAIGIACLVALGSYVITSLAGTVSLLEWPAKVLPYHYYHPADILSGASSGKWAMLSFAITALVLSIISWLGFRRRDIE